MCGKNDFTVGDYITYSEALDMGTVLAADALEWVQGSIAKTDLEKQLRESSIENLYRALDELDRLQREVYSRICSNRKGGKA